MKKNDEEKIFFPQNKNYQTLDKLKCLYHFFFNYSDCLDSHF